MQKYAGLAQTGYLDDATRSLINRPRCGLPDLVNDNTDILNHHLIIHNQRYSSKLFKKRVKRYSLQGGKWPRTNLTWR